MCTWLHVDPLICVPFVFSVPYLFWIPHSLDCQWVVQVDTRGMNWSYWAKAGCILCGIDVYRASLLQSLPPQTPINTPDTSVLYLLVQGILWPQGDFEPQLLLQGGGDAGPNPTNQMNLSLCQDPASETSPAPAGRSVGTVLLGSWAHSHAHQNTRPFSASPDEHIDPLNDIYRWAGAYLKVQDVQKLSVRLLTLVHSHTVAIAQELDRGEYITILTTYCNIFFKQCYLSLVIIIILRWSYYIYYI